MSPALLVEEIPVAAIVASATNPRKSIDQAQLAQLAASIATVGIMVPLTLRKSNEFYVSTGIGKVRYGACKNIVGHENVVETFSSGTAEENQLDAEEWAREQNRHGKFEIVGGERRWRAAQLAGLETVPAVVRVMSDAECRESQMIENLQREDLGPMEEAEGYQQLMRDNALPVEVLAAKTGKTVPHVTQRLRLLQLIPEARGALRMGALNLTLALLIGRLQPADQAKATLFAVDPKRLTEGKDLTERIADAARMLEEEAGWFRCAGEKEMREWIADNTLLTLKGVAWRLDDVDLIPGAGPCTECPKRAGNSTALFGDLAAEGDTCTDPTCYAKKQKAAVKEVLKRPDVVKLSNSESHMPLALGATALKQGQWVEAKEASCPDAMKGVTEDGHVKIVCGNQKCKTHKHRVDAPIAKGQSAGNWEAEQKARREKEGAYSAAELPIRKAIYAVIRPKLKGAKLLRLAISEVNVNGPMLAELRSIAVKGDGWDAVDRVLDQAFDKLKDADLEGWLADAVASEAVSVNGHRYDRRKDDRSALWNIGKLLGVDCDAIAAKFEKETAAVAKPAAKPKTKSSPKPSPAAASSPKAAKKKAKGGRP